MTGPVRIETSRLVLRPPGPGDADAIYSYAGDSEATRFMSWPRHTSPVDTQLFLEFSENAWRRWPAGPYAILTRGEERMIGCTGLAFETPRLASTGYVLARDVWGRGFATEALEAMVTLAPQLGVERLYALCHVDHRASARVLEKCGFEREGRLRQHCEFPNLSPGRLEDVFCYVRSFASDGAGPASGLPTGCGRRAE